MTGPLNTVRVRDVDPHPDGAWLGERAAKRAVDLVRAIRDEGPHEVARVTDRLDREGLIALTVALAALVPADVDPDVALEWVDLPSNEWSDRTLLGESARYDAGARDGTACAAHTELTRRAHATARQQPAGLRKAS